MKNFITSLLFSVMCIASSCAQKNSSLQKVYSAEEFIETILVEAQRVTGENALYIESEFDVKSKTYSKVNFSVIEPNFFVIDEFPKNVDVKKYIVTCTKGGKVTSTTECDGKFLCGSAVYDCLNGGGCGTICSAPLVYLPQTHDLIVLNK